MGPREVKRVCTKVVEPRVVDEAQGLSFLPPSSLSCSTAVCVCVCLGEDPCGGEGGWLDKECTVQSGKSRKEGHSPTPLPLPRSHGADYSFCSSLRAGPQPTCPGVSCQCLAVPSAWLLQRSCSFGRPGCACLLSSPLPLSSPPPASAAGRLASNCGFRAIKQLLKSQARLVICITSSRAWIQYLIHNIEYGY